MSPPAPSFQQSLSSSLQDARRKDKLFLLVPSSVSFPFPQTIPSASSVIHLILERSKFNSNPLLETWDQWPGPWVLLTSCMVGVSLSSRQRVNRPTSGAWRGSVCFHGRGWLDDLPHTGKRCVAMSPSWMQPAHKDHPIVSLWCHAGCDCCLREARVDLVSSQSIM